MDSLKCTKLNFRTDTPEDNFDIEKCIICQKITKEKLCSSENGRKRILDACEIRDDNVTKRLKHADCRENFMYHVSNNCYKIYTMKTNLDRIAEERGKKEIPSEVNCTKITRSESRRSPPMSDPSQTNIYHKQCIICDNKSVKKSYVKYRISESRRASEFLKATHFFQDAVFTRTCDIQDPTHAFGADLYYHNECMIKYLYQHESQSKVSTPYPSEKQLVWNEIAPELEKGFREGNGYDLSAIRDKLNSKNDKCCFENRDVKVFLIHHFGDAIDFSYPSDKSKSIMVFSLGSTSSNALAESIRSIDPIRTCADMWKALDNHDFGLDDRFCDAQDLSRACSDMEIPTPILQFLAYLYNFTLDAYKNAAREVMTDREEEDEDILKEDTFSAKKCRKIQSLFQIMYYIHQNGKKRTPLHIMNAESIHALGRGGKIVTSLFKREGLALSYSELRRYQCDMAMYIAHQNQQRISLPAHFEPEQFTSGAMDNWDHEGANVSEHDTVTVLFQDKPILAREKPKISDTNIQIGPQSFTDTLPCQVLQDFHKSSHKPDLPVSYAANRNVHKSDAARLSSLKDMTWSLARIHLSSNDVPVCPELQYVASWSACNSIWTCETIPVKSLAFLPVLPYSVTDYSTVFTGMNNLLAIKNQLDQDEFPLYADEKVYCMVKEIQLRRPNEFSSLIPMLGTFHMIKTVLKCIGKSLQGSGAEIVWLEAGIFGPTVIQNSVITGTHYSRSLEGMQLLAEAFQRLLYKEFFNQADATQYTEVFACLDKIKTYVSRMNFNEIKKTMDEFLTVSTNLSADLSSFVQQRSSENENFRFWVQFLNLVKIVHDLLRADREGLWDLHLDSVERAMHLFAAFDSRNYFRWGSVYLEDMRNLSETSPSVYAQFSRGNFSIKDKPGRFTAVAGDQKLEQSINLSSKCSDGIIGHAAQKQYIAQWDIIYHEMMALKNLHREYMGVSSGTYDSWTHHESSNKQTIRKEANIKAMIKFILEKGCPFSDECPPTLHNFVTKQVMSDTIRKDMHDVLKVGEVRYQELRYTRLVEKTSKIHDTIHRCNLQSMKTVNHSHQKTVRKAVKEINMAEKSIEVARDRGLTADDLLKYDICPSPMLFVEDGMMTKPEKSQLLKELESHITQNDYCYQHTIDTSFIIDVMANIRKVRTVGHQNFEQFGSAFLSLMSVYHQFGRCDYVFDMYSDKPSPKDNERMRRTTDRPIELSSIASETPLPKNMATFWPSKDNKLKFEKFIFDTIEQRAKHSSQFPTVLGQITTDTDYKQCIMIQSSLTHSMCDLNSPFEEADLRILLHVYNCVKSGYHKCVVLSNDTDVTIGLVYHMPSFTMGTGWSRGQHPLHTSPFYP